jgi:hypothetical protein
MAETNNGSDYRNEFRSLLAEFNLQTIGELLLIGAEEFQKKAHELAPPAHKAAMMGIGPTPDYPLRVVIAGGPMIEALDMAMDVVGKAVKDAGVGMETIRHHIEAGATPVEGAAGAADAVTAEKEFDDYLAQLSAVRLANLLLKVAEAMRAQTDKLSPAGMGMPLFRVGPVYGPGPKIAVAVAEEKYIPLFHEAMEQLARKIGLGPSGYTQSGTLGHTGFTVTPAPNPNDKPN